MSLWLAKAGVNTAGLAIHDGSGLSRLNLVTPTATVQLLKAIRHRIGGQVFLDSLPISGTDGTPRGRLQSVSGRVAAKTGTLTYDHSLSGYVVTADNKIWLSPL
jgi:D-alanyl-D-alanine carboxypeptidase/D-alanyl-D-alanine-endopeptidase (penicillin-binding protein 4)